jgi:hypothetical protein
MASHVQASPRIRFDNARARPNVSNLIYLGLAAIVTGVGCTIIWFRQRKPTGVDNGIDAFKRELQALAPDHDDPSAREARPTEDG